MAESGHPTPLELVRYLARAESRVRILEFLLDAGDATQRELRSELDPARTTVSRALQSLEEQGWVETDGQAFRLTTTGQLVSTEFLSMLETIDSIDRLSEFYRWFPPGIDPPDVRNVEEFTVTYTTDADPYAPARKQTRILSEVDRLRMLLPAIDYESTEAIADEVISGGLEAETVVSPSVEPVLESEEFVPLVERKMETGRSGIFIAPEPLPLYLGLADDGRVQVGLADDGGLPRALLETSDAGVRRWGESLYQGYREDARRKSPDEL